VIINKVFRRKRCLVGWQGAVERATIIVLHLFNALLPPVKRIGREEGITTRKHESSTNCEVTHFFGVVF